MQEGAGVLCGFDKVRGRHQRPAGQFRQMPAGKLGITARCVEPGADGGGAQIDLMQQSGGFDQTRLVFAQHHHERAELLAERHRYRILQLRAPDLDEAGKFLRLAVEGVLQNAHRGGQVVTRFDQAHIHRGRISIVGRLAEIDVIVRVKPGILALFVPKQFQRAVGDDLIGVHVGGCAGSALDFIHNELLMKSAGADFAAGFRNRLHPIPVEQAKFVICTCGRLFHIGQTP